MNNEHSRTKDVAGYEAGELGRHAGILAGTVEQVATALGTTPAAVDAALEEAPCLNDTAVPKGQSKRVRPTDPARRSLAFTRAQLAQLHATIITENEPIE